MSDNPPPSFFVVGQRYRNRIGAYEVLQVSQDEMRIRYDSGYESTLTNLDSQRRIVENVELEAEDFLPYPENDRRNKKYFYTLGLLCKRGRFEAIVPPKSQRGFERSYADISGKAPVPGQDMYYLHKEQSVDKWGSELRITLSCTTAELSRLDFGPGINVVNSPNASEYRINNNGFIWRLWEMGFRLGDKHDASMVRKRIPLKFVPDFDQGQA